MVSKEGERMSYFKSNKALTLVEIIISLAILSIVLMIIFSFYNFGTKTFSKGKDEYNSQSNARLVSDYITDQVRLSTKVTLSDYTIDTTFENKYSYFYVDGNIVYHKKWNGTSHDNQIFTDLVNSISFTGSNDDLTLKVTGIGNSKEYVLTSEIPMPNLYLNPSENVVGSGNMIKYSKLEEFVYDGSTPSAGELTINNSPPIGYKTISYSHTFSATGGVSPYTFILKSGVLPSGLIFDSNGLISGTPTEAKTNEIIIEVTDSSEPPIKTSQTFNITIVGTVTATFIKGDESATNPSPPSKIVTIGEKYGELPVISRPGRTFGGWYTEGGILITSDSYVTTTSNHKLVANWIK